MSCAWLKIHTQLHLPKITIINLRWEPMVRFTWKKVTKKYQRLFHSVNLSYIHYTVSLKPKIREIHEMLNGIYLKFLLNLGLKIFPINEQTQGK